VLALAQEKIRDPQHWTQRVLARTRDNVPINPTFDDAARWCAAGAVCAVTLQNRQTPRPVSNELPWGGGVRGEDLNRAAMAYLHMASEKLTGLGVTTVNDFHGHATTMRAFDLAITMAAAGKELLEDLEDTPAGFPAREFRAATQT
jgi:hypothetical protein